MPENVNIHLDWPQATGNEEYGQLLEKLTRIKANRRVRPVVTRTGHRARGELPSFKAARVRYESLLEKRMWHVAEVASDVLGYSTHPIVLRLGLEGRVRHYTPDAVVNYRGIGRVLEVKASFFIRDASSRARLLEIVKQLRYEGIRLVLLTDSDVPASLDSELALLLRLRPGRGRYREGLNAERFDPCGRAVPNADLERRWLAAQRECNQLLARVMRRDPDDLIAAIAR